MLNTPDKGKSQYGQMLYGFELVNLGKLLSVMFVSIDKTFAQRGTDYGECTMQVIRNLANNMRIHLPKVIT